MLLRLRSHWLGFVDMIDRLLKEREGKRRFSKTASLSSLLLLLLRSHLDQQHHSIRVNSWYCQLLHRHGRLSTDGRENKWTRQNVNIQFTEDLDWEKLTHWAEPVEQLPWVSEVEPQGRAATEVIATRAKVMTVENCILSSSSSWERSWRECREWRQWVVWDEERRD